LVVRYNALSDRLKSFYLSHLKFDITNHVQYVDLSGTSIAGTRGCSQVFGASEKWKGSEGTIPSIGKNAKRILVSGTHADDIGYQCGGWTIAWHGDSGKITLGKMELCFAQTNICSYKFFRTSYILYFVLSSNCLT